MIRREARQILGFLPGGEKIMGKLTIRDLTNGTISYIMLS
jgi:hypothetical protein